MSWLLITEVFLFSVLEEVECHDLGKKKNHSEEKATENVHFCMCD